MRQQANLNSDWAWLSTLDAQLAINEADQRKKCRIREQQQTRQALDCQLQVSIAAGPSLVQVTTPASTILAHSGTRTTSSSRAGSEGG